MAYLPKQVETMAADSPFRFHCHPGVPCFTACCRELELALSPYDVIRLKQALGLSSHDFLERYAIIEFAKDDLYPKVYLAMVDDGRASCPFVDASGCRVYHDRPAACRTYPVGRGVSLDKHGAKKEQFIIIREEHCRGFAENQTQTVHDWQSDQQTCDYNRCNDLLLPLLHPSDHSPPRQRLSSEKATLFIDTLYNLELFQSRCSQNSTNCAASPDDEPALLRSAIDWLQQQWQTVR